MQEEESEEEQSDGESVPPNPDAPFLAFDGAKTWLVDPLSGNACRVPNEGFHLQKELSSEGIKYLLHGIDGSKPAYVHRIVSSPKAVRIECLVSKSEKQINHSTHGRKEITPGTLTARG